MLEALVIIASNVTSSAVQRIFSIITDQDTNTEHVTVALWIHSFLCHIHLINHCFNTDLT